MPLTSLYLHAKQHATTIGSHQAANRKQEMHAVSDIETYADIKVHGANMGSIWGRQDPGGPYVGPMNLAIWDKEGETMKKYKIK